MAARPPHHLVAVGIALRRAPPLVTLLEYWFPPEGGCGTYRRRDERRVQCLFRTFFLSARPIPTLQRSMVPVVELVMCYAFVCRVRSILAIISRSFGTHLVMILGSRVGLPRHWLELLFLFSVCFFIDCVQPIQTMVIYTLLTIMSTVPVTGSVQQPRLPQSSALPRSRSANLFTTLNIPELD